MLMNEIFDQQSLKAYATMPIGIWVVKVIPLFALRIPTAPDSRVISACKLARGRTQRKKFPSS